jgi:hypothetical protein
MRRLLGRGKWWWALLMVTTSHAFAHGLPPGTTSIQTRVSHPDDWLLGSNFGPLVRSGAAAPYRVICAEGIGYPEGYETSLHWGADGRFMLGNAAGLFTSTDGCSWNHLPELANQGVTDVFHEPSSGTLFASTSKFDGQNGVWTSTNGGQSFTQSALVFPKLYFTGVRSSVAVPSRLYASAWWYDPNQVKLYRSDNGGGAWSEVTMTTPGVGPFFILGVSPANADVVFAFLSGPTSDSLLRSENAGQDFVSVLETEGGRRQLEISADGNTVWMSTTRKLYRSADGGKTFTPLPSPTGNACLYRDANSLYTCGSSAVDGYSVGKSTNGGDSFEPVFKLRDVAGVLSCPAGTPVHDNCEPLWSALRLQLSDVPLPEYQPTPKGGGCATTGEGWVWPSVFGVLWATLLGRRENCPNRRRSP